eukprot:4222438-Prymnesium_polylepis.1
MNVTNVTINGECAAAAAVRLAASGSGAPPNTIVLGIMMGIAGSVGVNVGQNIQKEENWGKAWNYFGLGVFISFAIVNFVAFGFALPLCCPRSREHSLFVDWRRPSTMAD